MAVSASFTYDVFISFRGPDTRYGFTGYLYNALIGKEIRTFIDDKDLERGHEITPSLQKAIEESRIAIVVLSNNYASSSFCLDELAMIIDYFKEKGRLVLPVFYDVDPSDVRKQKGIYGEAFAMHKERFNDNMKRLEKWRTALQQVAGLSGWHLKLGDGYEYEFIQKIVAHVSTKIKRVTLPVADYPVGLESRVLEVNSLLVVKCDDGVRMVGIHGIGGIGKTTLTLAVCNLIADHFEGLCFLENVRENSDKYGLLHLQKILLSQTLGEKKIKLSSVRQGISEIQRRLQRKKVLLILDDVDKAEQLEALVGGSDWLGSGSTVIITTRDKHLLARYEIIKTYELKKLDKKDALQLLTWKAFKMEKVDPSYMDVLNRAVSYASGLPLALVVMGSNLFEKSIEEWKSALRRYESIPNKEIQKILRVSFDALEEDEQRVFLDITCCFKGYGLAKVKELLRAHYGDCMKYHIGVLVEKSLLKISWYGEVIVHDLIEAMGKEIVRQQSLKEPGKRSRLWFHKDIVQVLEQNTGTSAIEIIYLVFPSFEEEGEVVALNDMAFKKMRNLKTLIIRNAHFSKGPKHLPNSLRVLEWWRYPSQYLPYDFHPKELTIFKLPKSCLTSLKLVDSSKKLVNVRVLNLDGTECLTQIPDVSSLPSLEDFSFQDCENLITIHESVGFLEKLKILSASGCSNLRSFPSIKLISLEKFDFSFCSCLENFPEVLEKMENITELDLLGTSIKELPFSFQKLTRLRKLGLKGGEMFRLPSHVVMMPELVEIGSWYWKGWVLPTQDEGKEKLSSMVSSNVERLQLTGCNLSNEFFPIGLTWFANVKELILTSNNFTILPECFKEYHFLRKLYLGFCEYLREVRGTPPNLKFFEAQQCNSLTFTDKLLNQELHEAGNTKFYLPGTKIPDWFEHHSKGGSISFWFRNKFPSIALCLVTGSTFVKSDIIPIMVINGYKSIFDYRYGFYLEMEPSYTYIFDLQTIKFEDNLEEAFLENEWNHAEIMYRDENNSPVLVESGIHVLNQKSNMEHIQFTNPYGKRKIDDDLNSSEITNSLVSKKMEREDDGWTLVNRRRSSGSVRWNYGENGRVMQQRRTSKVYQDGQAGVVTFYFTNFPDGYAVGSLRKIFMKWGNVVNVHIPWKRNKIGLRFGFVRFKDVNQPSLLEEQLKELWIGTYKVRVNISRFSRHYNRKGFRIW